MRRISLSFLLFFAILNSNINLLAKDSEKDSETVFIIEDGEQREATKADLDELNKKIEKTIKDGSDVVMTSKKDEDSEEYLEGILSSLKEEGRLANVKETVYNSANYVYDKYNTFSENLLYTPYIGFFWGQVPAFKEVLIDSSYQALADTILGAYSTDNLGDNPAVKAFLRDGIKIFSTIQKARLSVPLGRHVFDESNVYSQVVKTVVKVGGIFVIYRFFKYPTPKSISTESWTRNEAGRLAKISEFASSGKISQEAITSALKDSAKLANYPGDIFSRVLIKAGRDRQDEKSPKEFFSYFRDFKPTWVVSSVVEIIPKGSAMYYVGGAIAKTGVSAAARASIYILANYFLPGKYDVKAHSYQSAWNDVNGMGRLKYLALPFAFVSQSLVRFTGFFVDKGVTTYLMAIPARTVMGAIDKGLKHKQYGVFVNSESAYKKLYNYAFPANLENGLSNSTKEEL